MTCTLKDIKVDTIATGNVSSPGKEPQGGTNSNENALIWLPEIAHGNIMKKQRNVTDMHSWLARFWIPWEPEGKFLFISMGIGFWPPKIIVQMSLWLIF